MPVGIDKEARKQSKDPAQEKLRDHKEAWNEAASLLVAKLIAFKRGLNGRGDVNAGLPPVDIKDPFPTEMSTYLSSIADDYVRLVQGASYVIKNQDQYSKTRRKSKKESSLNQELISEASWWGSRAWARLSLIGMGKNIRKLRLSMINFLNELFHDLHNIENDLTSGYANGTARSVIRTINVLQEFTNYLAPAYKQLILETPKELPEAPGQPAEKETVEIDEPVETEVIYQEEAPAGLDKATLDRIAYINEHWGDLGTKVAIIQQSDIIDTNTKNSFNKVHNELVTAMANYGSIVDDTSGQFIANKKQLSDDIINKYNELIGMLNYIRGEYNITANMHEDKVKLAVVKLQQQEDEIRKIAHNSFKRWINRKIMSISPSKVEMIKLDTIDRLHKLHKVADSLMNVLETRKSSSSDIMAHFNALVAHLFGVMGKIKVLGEIYYTQQDMRKKHKGERVLKLKKEHLNQLDSLSSELEKYTQSG